MPPAQPRRREEPKQTGELTASQLQVLHSMFHNTFQLRRGTFDEFWGLVNSKCVGRPYIGREMNDFIKQKEAGTAPPKPKKERAQTFWRILKKMP